MWKEPAAGPVFRVIIPPFFLSSLGGEAAMTTGRQVHTSMGVRFSQDTVRNTCRGTSYLAPGTQKEKVS